MEGAVGDMRLYPCHLLILGLGLNFFGAAALAQTPVQTAPRAGQAEMSLRKSVNTREYRGQEVQGEERQVGRGDTLWRILVEEKGLSGKQFRSYLVVIRGLNPEVKNLDVLRVGDKIFIPLRTDELVEGTAKREVAAAERTSSGRGATIDYRVKAGEHLYQILREQLKVSEERKIAQYYALVKDLNPERKNWDTLVEGEIIRLPTMGRVQEATASAPIPVVEPKRAGDAVVGSTSKPISEAKAPAPPQAALTPPDRRSALRAPAKENMALFATVVEAIGGQMQQSGEEIVSVKEGTIRFDKGNYPVVSNPALGQRVVIDPDDKIPASLRSKLSDPSVGTQVLAMSNGVSIQEAVGQLLARLGYQSLPSDRPVIIQEEGIAYEAKGNWIALAPEQSNRTQDVFVINLTEGPGEIPDYLKSQLAKRGLHLRDVRLASTTVQQTTSERPQAPKDFVGQTRNWPRDKKEMVDALLLSFNIPFGVAETLSVDLGEGLRVDARIDRIFEQSGKRTALFFQRADPDIRKALQDKQGVRTIELDVGSLSSRDLITRTLNMLGDQASYREHRFPAAYGSASERLTITAWGFHLAARSMFVTDRQIPPSLHRFFFEKGLEIVYFQ
jgi:hypothetical protein